METNIKITIADDHQLFREGLGLLLRSQPGMQVIAEATNGRDAVQLAERLSPDVIVMDINMPDLNGIDATREITSRSDRDSPRIVALSALSNPQTVSATLKAGAKAYVRKDLAFNELADAIRAVMDNKVYLSEGLAPPAPETVAVENEQPSAYSQLSARERKVLQLIAEGQSTKEAARTLGLSTKTIESHRRNMMEKLQIYSVAELTRYAIEEGITTV